MTLITSFISILAAVGVVAAGPLTKRAVTQAQYNQLVLLEQWAAASYCPGNDGATTGSKVVCSTGNCPIVQSDNTTVLLSIPTTPLSDTAGFVALDHTNKLIVASFRGTESVRNYLTDVNFVMLPVPDICSGCGGFAGIYVAWKEVEDEIVSTVQAAQAQYPDYRAQATGHSLGGGIATFAVAGLRNAGIVTDMTTFGAPRVGDENFVEYVMSQAPSLGQNYRVTHILDVVPNLPPLINGFRHVSPNYYITAPGMSPVTPADIVIQPGTTVENPPGATTDEDTVAHSYYMGLPVSVCYPSGILIPFRRMAKRESIAVAAMAA